MKFLTPLVAAGVLTATVAAEVAPGSTVDEWQVMRDGIDAWHALGFDKHFNVAVGTETENLFLHSPDNYSMEATFAGASYGKWGAAVMIAGLVNDGTLGWDDKASKYLDFWATDSSDVRSEVTLRELLSFTSGFLEDVDDMYGCTDDFVTCAEATYKATTKYTAPNKVFMYLSCHLQFAGAMAVSASGKDIQTLLKEYLYEPYDWKFSTYGEHPVLAVTIETAGKDVVNFLQNMLSYKAVPKAILDVVETDYIKDGIDGEDTGNWFGHYGMGHYWECMGYGTPYEPKVLQKDCLARHIQAGPGANGIYPLLDRSGGGGAAGVERPPQYFAVIIAESTAMSGIPEYLRIVAKPVADYIMNGTDVSTMKKSELLAASGGLIARDITYIKSQLKGCECSGAQGSKGEPFATLLKGLPDDKPNSNRREILGDGDGVTLLDITEAQKTLGTCKCFVH